MKTTYTCTTWNGETFKKEHDDVCATHMFEVADMLMGPGIMRVDIDHIADNGNHTHGYKLNTAVPAGYHWAVVPDEA